MLSESSRIVAFFSPSAWETTFWPSVESRSKVCEISKKVFERACSNALKLAPSMVLQAICWKLVSQTGLGDLKQQAFGSLLVGLGTTVLVSRIAKQILCQRTPGVDVNLIDQHVLGGFMSSAMGVVFSCVGWPCLRYGKCFSDEERIFFVVFSVFSFLCLFERIFGEKKLTARQCLQKALMEEVICPQYDQHQFPDSVLKLQRLFVLECLENASKKDFSQFLGMASENRTLQSRLEVLRKRCRTLSENDRKVLLARFCEHLFDEEAKNRSEIQKHLHLLESYSYLSPENELLVQEIYQAITAFIAEVRDALTQNTTRMFQLLLPLSQKRPWWLQALWFFNTP